MFLNEFFKYRETFCVGCLTKVNNDMKLILAGGVNSDSAVSFASNSPRCLPGFVKVIKMVEEDEQ